MSEDGPDLSCDRCGAPDAHRIGTDLLCADCFQLAGACCAGESPDDGSRCGFDGSVRGVEGGAVSDPLQKQRDMVARFPTNELARFSLGKALYDRGELAEARVHLEEALARRPDWMVVQILIGRCDLAAGNREAAAAAFRRALQLAVDQHHEGPQAELESLLSELELN